MIRLLSWFSIPILIVSLTVSACVVQKNPVSGKSRAYGYSWEKELQIGKEADGQIQQQYGVYDDQEVRNYVEELGQEVLSVSHMRRENTDPKYKNTEFYFRVLNSPVVNAFALPGGYVYITRGLLSHLNNEAQLAVVLGHEIGHVAARHASQRAFEQQVGQIALVGGAIAGQELLGLPGQDLLNLGSTATQLLFLQYGRDDERESDQLGVEYAAMQHYVAAEGADFFTSLKRLSDKSGQNIPSFLSTHPEPGEREKRIPQLAEEWKEKGYEQTKINKDGYMNTIDGIIYGNNPREGFTRGNVFYHPELEFQFPVPTGWQVINEPTRVILANEDGNAVMIMQIDSEAGGAQQSVQNFVSQEGITVTEQSAAADSDLPAYEATANATTQDGTKLGIYVYGIEYGGNVYRFISYTTAVQFDSQKSNFFATTDGFRELTDSDILGIQPVRLQVIKTDRSGTFSSFLPEELPMDITAEELAIVNQVHLDSQIEQGQYLKIPRQ
ncbi:M48 family metalloprotease [Aliifodinibius sp. S!AR15-10]|uniref:M48 family metalloprotease n=1 Tax=Aliifodinibius sp. S!AR15-10 TaxID=2950437 RepID=UPI0028598FBB|nr:M48 family metalloprotease [Aliifodinibius sp. S!AR15-10]MDR8390328.1 M48 family metalloprotease [Aliifodinibius sp. S!AR15-10]